MKQPQASEKTRGGIFLPKQSQNAQDSLMNKGQVVALGPLCYRGERFVNPASGEAEPWCKPGDFIQYDRHAGQTYDVMEGDTQVKYRFVDDTQVLAVFENESEMFSVKDYIFSGDFPQ